MDLDLARDIVARLRPVLEEQGLELEVTGAEGGEVRLRGRRVGRGAPMAFMVKAVEGTFRRYLPGFASVRLEDFEEAPAPPPPPPPPPAGPGFRGVPGVDLSGADRAQAARALETFATLARRRGAGRFKVRGLGQDPALRAAEKWRDMYRQDLGAVHAEEGRPDSWIVHLDGLCADPACSAGQPEELLPASVLLV